MNLKRVTAIVLFFLALALLAGSGIEHIRYGQAQKEASIIRPGEVVVIGSSKFTAPSEIESMRNLVFLASVAAGVGALVMFFASRREVEVKPVSIMSLTEAGNATLVARSKSDSSNRSETNPRSTPVFQKETQAANHWDRAIAAAESGNQSEALKEFRFAIETNPDYYISVIQPRSDLARSCWQKAVEQYVQKADAKASTKPAAAFCSDCRKEVGADWHYDFESIVFAKTVAAQCPKCGQFLCDDHLEFGPDGNYKPCSQCNVRLFTLSAGAAYSSMVEQARRERRYRGPIKEPSFLSRTHKMG